MGRTWIVACDVHESVDYFNSLVPVMHDTSNYQVRFSLSLNSYSNKFILIN